MRSSLGMLIWASSHHCPPTGRAPFDSNFESEYLVFALPEGNYSPGSRYHGWLYGNGCKHGRYSRWLVDTMPITHPSTPQTSRIGIDLNLKEFRRRYRLQGYLTLRVDARPHHGDVNPLSTPLYQPNLLMNYIPWCPLMFSLCSPGNQTSAVLFIFFFWNSRAAMSHD